MLTDNERATVRVEVGDDPDDATLDAIHARRGTVGGVVYDVLAARLATLLAAPASFAIPGEYSQSTGANITALKERLARWSAFAPEGSSENSVVGVTRLESRHSRTANSRRGGTHASAES